MNTKYLFISSDDYDSDTSEPDDDTRPKTRAELENMALKSVKKRETTAKKDGYRYDPTDTKDKKKKDKGKKA